MIYIINCILLLLAAVAFNGSNRINQFIKVVYFLTAIYNGFEAYSFYILGVIK